MRNVETMQFCDAKGRRRRYLASCDPQPQSAQTVFSANDLKELHE